MPPRPCHHVLSLIYSGETRFGGDSSGSRLCIDTSRGWGLTGRSRSAGALGVGRAAWPDPGGPGMLRRAVASSLAGPGEERLGSIFILTSLLSLPCREQTKELRAGAGRQSGNRWLPTLRDTPRAPGGGARQARRPREALRALRTAPRARWGEWGAFRAPRRKRGRLSSAALTGGYSCAHAILAFLTSLAPTRSLPDGPFHGADAELRDSGAHLRLARERLTTPRVPRPDAALPPRGRPRP